MSSFYVDQFGGKTVYLLVFESLCIYFCVQRLETSQILSLILFLLLIKK